MENGKAEKEMKLFNQFFEGSDQGQGDQGQGQGDQGQGDQGQGGQGQGTPKSGAPKFDAQQQAYINSLLAKDKRKYQKEVDDLTKRLGTLELDAQAKQTLEQELETTRQSFLTEKEQLELKNQKFAQEHERTVKTLTEERDLWKSRYTSETIARSLTDAANANDAFNPAQVVDMLSTKTQIVDEVDDSGKKTGKLVVRVKITLPNSKGEMQEMVLAPDDAVKQMKETPRLYGNLFKGTQVSGNGLNNGNITLADPSKVGKDPAAYRKARKAGQI